VFLAPQIRTCAVKRIRLKHRTTPLRGTTGRGSTGPRHPLRSAVAPLALGSTWTVLRQSRLPKIGGGRTTGVAVRVISALPPSRLAVGSHPPTPGGSQLAFARGDLATPIRPITGRPSLPPPSFTRRPVGSPCGWPTLAGGRRAYHVASQESSWVRPRLDAGGTSSAPDESAASGPGHLPFWSKPISTFGLSLFTTLAAVHLGWPYHAPLVPDRFGAGSRDLASRSGRHPKGYGYVVPRASHPPVARDARLGRGLLAEQQVLSPPLSKSNTVPATPSCRTLPVALR